MEGVCAFAFSKMKHASAVNKSRFFIKSLFGHKNSLSSEEDISHQE